MCDASLHRDLACADGGGSHRGGCRACTASAAVSVDLWWWHLAAMRHPLTIAGAQPGCDCGHQRRKARTSHQGCCRGAPQCPALRSRVRVAGRHDPGRPVANPWRVIVVDGRTPRLEAYAVGNVPALRACLAARPLLQRNPSEPLPASRLPPTDSDPGVAPLRCHGNYRRTRLARHACPGESAPRRKQEGCSKGARQHVCRRVSGVRSTLSSSTDDDQRPTTRSTRIYDLQLLPQR